MDRFGARRIDETDAGLVDDFVDAKLRGRQAIDEAAARGSPLMETYTDPRTGRTWQRRRRGLSNGSINKVLAAARLVLKDAVRNKLIDHNPLENRECFLREPQPTRSFLEVAQTLALFEAGRAAEREHRGLTWKDVHDIRQSSEPALRLARRLHVSEALIRKIRRRDVLTRRPERRRNYVPRQPLIATLVLSGIRISELCTLTVATWTSRDG